MKKCRTCEWGNGLHDPGCPERPGLAPAAQKEEWAAYHEGWGHGRSGAPPDRTINGPKGKNPAFRLGFLNGVVALEATENGHDPRFDD